MPESSTDSEAAEQMRTFYDAVAIPADSFARAVTFAMSRPGRRVRSSDVAAIHQGSYVTMNLLLFASAALLLGAALQGQTPPESEIVAVW